MKRYFFLFFTFFIVIIVTTSCSFSSRDSSDVTFDFSLNEDQTSYTIRGSNIAHKTQNDNWNMVDVILPSEHNGLPVTQIGYGAFRNSQILRSIIIPGSITTIASNAFFDCNNIISIDIPDSVEYILGEPFRSCNSLEAINVDANNPNYNSVDGILYTKDMRGLLFYPPGKECSEFIIPEGVSDIYKFAFSHCINLESIVIASTVSRIPYDAIMFCDNFKGVKVSEHNRTYDSIDGNLYSKDKSALLRLYYAGKDNSFDIPNGVVTIADYAMYLCERLTTISIPNTVSSIGKFAFCQAGIKSVILPSSITYIGQKAFFGCNKLETANFEGTSSWRVIPTEGKFVSETIIDSQQLKSSFTNANYLAQTYSSCQWFLKEDN